MIVVRVIGYLLLIAGLMVFGRDLLGWHDTGHFNPVALGPLWLEVSRSSYQAAQGALAPWLLYALRGILVLWAAPSLIVLGAVLALAARGRRRGRRRH
ncbi:MAG TPA: hypothetical protein VLV50_03490 [Stellaceae bacterium]|nr:hypothetical protein [Stellaceae bacterium]